MEKIDKIITINGETKVLQYKKGCFPCYFCKKGACDWDKYYKKKPTCDEDCDGWREWVMAKSER